MRHVYLCSLLLTYNSLVIIGVVGNSQNYSITELGLTVELSLWD